VRTEQNVSSKLQALAQAALKYAHARLDLLQHEWQAEQSRLLGVLIRSALFALALLTTYQLLAAALIAAMWDTAWRVHTVLALAGLTAAIGAYAWHSLRARPATSASAFATSLAEFDKDREALGQLISSSQSEAKAAANGAAATATTQAAEARERSVESELPPHPPGASRNLH
jgi:uncharacterized membrane protein YqjE